MNTLLTARFTEKAIHILESQVGQVQRAGFGVYGKKLSSPALLGMASDSELVIVEFESLDADFFAATPRLKLVACCRNEPAASIDLAAATLTGIPVLYAPGRNAVSVAEYTMGMMIAIARGLHTAHHLLCHTEELTSVTYADKTSSRSNITSEWSLEPGAPFHRFQGPELSGKVLGLVGCGLIGREIAIRARAFGMLLAIYDPYVSTSTLRELAARPASLVEVVSMADFLVVAAKVTPETRGLISQRVLASLKPTAYVINTARAAVVDYGALVDLLREGRIAGAALDVYPSEPLNSNHPLRSLDNVLLSPHLAGASTDIPAHHSRMIVDDVLRVLSGNTPCNIANPSVWPSRRK